MNKGREWLIDDFIKPSPSISNDSEMIMTLMTTKSGSGSSNGFRMSNSGTVTGFGGMSALTHETDNRSRLAAQMTRKGLLNCTSSTVSLSNQLPQIKNKLFDSSVSSKEDYGGKPAMSGNISTPIETIWRTGVSHHPEAVLDTALSQMNRSTTSLVNDPNMIPVMNKPHFNNNIERGVFKMEPKLEDKPLLSASQRRRVYQQEREHQNALQALGNARRNYKRIEFIAKNQYPNGMLTSERIEPGNTTYADVVAQLQRDEMGAEAERLKRSALLKQAAVKKGSGGQAFLQHDCNNKDQMTIFQRKHHTIGVPDKFLLSKMEEPVPFKIDPRRKQLVSYSQTQGRDRNIITSVKTAKVETPFV